LGGKKGRVKTPTHNTIIVKFEEIKASIADPENFGAIFAIIDVLLMGNSSYEAMIRELKV
jgi:hypothetical protein